MKDWNTAPNIPKIPMTGSSHVTAINDRNTKESLSDLYNGSLGKFFKTDKRY